MSELVKDLRHMAEYSDQFDSHERPDCSDLLIKAAIEIERLSRLGPEERAALEYVIADLDGWTESLTKSLADPEFGMAVSDYSTFIKETKEELEDRKRHSATLKLMASV